MAKTINTAGSQLFQQNLSNYNRERSRDELTQKSEANRLGNQLTALSLDPDINDPSLGQIGMAASADPGGIIGTIAGAVGKVKQMDAMKLKAEANEGRTQQMADMIKSNFEEMSDADALMYARDPDKMKQMMGLKDYSQKQKYLKEDRAYLKAQRERQGILNTRADDEYFDQQVEKEYFEDNKEGYRQQLLDLGLDEGTAEFATMNQANWNNYLQDVYKRGMDVNQKRMIYKQNKATFAEFNINSFRQLQLIEKLPPALAQKIFNNGYAEKYRAPLNELRRKAGDARSVIAASTPVAQQLALEDLLPDSMVEADYLKQIDPETDEPYENPPLPDELSAHRLTMYNNQIANKDSKFYQDFQSRVNSYLSPYTNELLQHTQAMGSLTAQHPTLLKPLTYSDAGYRDEAIQKLPEGTFFNFGGTRAMVIDTQNGKSFVDETDDRFNDDLYELLNGGTGAEALEANVPAPFALPDNDEVDDAPKVIDIGNKSPGEAVKALQARIGELRRQGPEINSKRQEAISGTMPGSPMVPMGYGGFVFGDTKTDRPVTVDYILKQNEKFDKYENDRKAELIKVEAQLKALEEALKPK
jgi:hypothetical protein